MPGGLLGGDDPADDPTSYAVRSGGVFLDEDADWVSATQSLREAYVSHPELDPAIVGGFV